MNIIKSIGQAVVKTVTAPLRFVQNVGLMVGNGLQAAGCLLKGDMAGVKRNMGELWTATKGAAFSGVESAFLLAGGAAALGAKATLGAAATHVGGHVVGSSALKETAKKVGGTFVDGYSAIKTRVSG